MTVFTARPFQVQCGANLHAVGNLGQTFRRQPQLGLRLLVSIMAATSSGDGSCGPGLPRRFGEKSCRYFRFTNAECKARRVEGFSTMAARSNRPGRMKSVHRPAMTRSIGRRLGARSRPRFRTTNWCFRRRDSATTARPPRVHQFRDRGD